MHVLLQVDFPYHGPFGDEMTQAMDALSASINQEPGFIWKIWTENKEIQKAGGIYLFDSKENAQAYLDKHSARLKSFGIPEVRGDIFTVNQALSLKNQASFLAK